jgi:hypothetical protein
MFLLAIKYPFLGYLVGMKINVCGLSHLMMKAIHLGETSENLCIRVGGVLIGLPFSVMRLLNMTVFY